MCLMTLIIWVVLGAAVVLTGQFVHDNDVTVVIGLSALGVGIVAPVVLSYWRPVFLGWAGKKKKLQARLMSEGVLNNEDLEKGARLVELCEAKPGTEKRVPKTKQLGFLLLEGKACRMFGEKTCFSAEKFSVIPSSTGKCSRCWVIWACGGDTFRLRVNVNGADKDYLVRCLEGRTLRQTARATEMLEEMAEIDSGEKKTVCGCGCGQNTAPSAGNPPAGGCCSDKQA